jgi:hypothetical protein
MPAETAIAKAPMVSTPSAVDFSLPFFPARLTALYFTPSWQNLTEPQRLRYTQIYALYLNEQTAFFEELLATNLLPALYSRPDRIGADLADDLRQFETEERKHSRWFRDMNHRIDPANFHLTSGAYTLIPASPGILRITTWFAKRPFAFPFWIWLMLLQEERSVAIARECLRPEEVLDPNFRELHRRHLADEIDHVRWDIKLVERLWLPLPLRTRRFQAALFGWMMREFFTTPKRGGRAVLDAWLACFPELQPDAPRFHTQLAALAYSRDYHASLYSRETTPRAFAFFDRLPEFENIGKSLPAYQQVT